jgi:hypothetical protein
MNAGIPSEKKRYSVHAAGVRQRREKLQEEPPAFAVGSSNEKTSNESPLQETPMTPSPETAPRALLTTIAGSLPKPSWLSPPNQLWAPWLLEGERLARVSTTRSASRSPSSGAPA